MSMIEGVLAGMSMRNKQQNDAEDREFLRKQRQQADEDRAFAMSERARALKTREDMANAAAEVKPFEVKQERPDTMDDRDVGQPGEAPLPTVGYDVAGKRFADRASADAAAAEANTPQAAYARMAQVALRNGDPKGAMELNKSAMEEQTGRYKLNDAQREDLAGRFNFELQQAQDWDALDKIASQASGHTIKTVLSPDGKTRTVSVVGPDGALIPTEKTFQATADGFAEARGGLAQLPWDKQLNYLYQKATLAQQAKRDAETGRHNASMEGIAQQNANTQEQYRRDQAEAIRMRADAAAANAQPGGMTLADLKDGHKGIASTLNADWKTQIESETDPAKLKALKVARENEIATVQRLYTGAMTAGFGMTPEQAIVAFRSGETATQTFKSKDGSGTVKVDGILYGGRFIPLADNPGAVPGAKPPPTSKDEAIARDAAETGTKDYVVDINGRRQAYGNAKLPEDRTAGKPASMTDRTAAAAPAPAADANLAKRLQAEQVEMSQGKRLQYSPEVAAYAKQRDAEARAAAAEASRVARQEELKKALRNPSMAQVRQDAARVK